MAKFEINATYAYPELDQTKLPITNGYLFKVLDESIPNDILDFLEKKFECVASNKFPVSFINDSTVISNNNQKKYMQWCLQNEPSCDQWISSDMILVENYLKQWVENIVNFRFSLTSGKTDVSWHVLHELPRIHIPLSDNVCFCDIRDTTQETHEVELKKGKLYLLNVCYPHRVRNPYDSERRQAFFSFNKLKPHV